MFFKSTVFCLISDEYVGHSLHLHDNLDNVKGKRENCSGEEEGPLNIVLFFVQASGEIQYSK